MSIYTSKPIQKMPEILIYKLNDEVYRIINTKEVRHAGDIRMFPVRKNYFQNELWIDAFILNKDQRNQGIGTKILKFAEILSTQMGFKGKLGLIASTLDINARVGSDSIEVISKTPPHKFYRKFGFKSKYKKFNNYIDDFIKNDASMEFVQMPALDMHYTPKNQSKKQKIIDWLCNLIP